MSTQIAVIVRVLIKIIFVIVLIGRILLSLVMIIVVIVVHILGQVNRVLVIVAGYGRLLTRRGMRWGRYGPRRGTGGRACRRQALLGKLMLLHAAHVSVWNGVHGIVSVWAVDERGAQHLHASAGRQRWQRHRLLDFLRYGRRGRMKDLPILVVDHTAAHAAVTARQAVTHVQLDEFDFKKVVLLLKLFNFVGQISVDLLVFGIGGGQLLDYGLFVLVKLLAAVYKHWIAFNTTRTVGLLVSLIIEAVFNDNGRLVNFIDRFIRICGVGVDTWIMVLDKECYVCCGGGPGLVDQCLDAALLLLNRKKKLA